MSVSKIDKKIISKAKEYYHNSDIADFIFSWIEYREGMAILSNGKVYRPLKIASPDDIRNAGFFVSFHATQEKFTENVNITNNIDEEHVRAYDITIDIDCKDTKYFKAWELSKKITEKILLLLNDFNIIPLIKYSGNRGFHIIIPDAIPKDSHFFKYRYFVHRALLLLINLYVKSIFPNILAEMKVPEVLFYEDIVSIDIQVASPRHMLRVPFSLHEKTGLVSVLIPYNKLKNFKPEMADPDIVIIPKDMRFNRGELDKLLLVSLLLYYRFKKLESSTRYVIYKFMFKEGKKSGKKLNIKNIPEEELYPPCVRKLLQGVEPGMRNNTMFFLIHFFKKLGKSFDEIQKIIYEWNERNKEPLKEREVDYALRYHWEHDYMPYSCAKIKELFGQEYCQPDEFCAGIKNPIQYPYRKLKMLRKNLKATNDKQ